MDHTASMSATQFRNDRPVSWAAECSCGATFTGLLLDVVDALWRTHIREVTGQTLRPIHPNTRTDRIKEKS